MEDLKLRRKVTGKTYAVTKFWIDDGVGYYSVNVFSSEGKARAFVAVESKSSTANFDTVECVIDDRCEAIQDGQTALPSTVDHPKHYNSHPSGIEAIAITEHMNFCLGNAIKYIWRADMKGGVEDLQKAKWYIEREIAKRSTD